MADQSQNPPTQPPQQELSALLKVIQDLEAKVISLSQQPTSDVPKPIDQQANLDVQSKTDFFKIEKWKVTEDSNKKVIIKKKSIFVTPETLEEYHKAYLEKGSETDLVAVNILSSHVKDLTRRTILIVRGKINAVLVDNYVADINHPDIFFMVKSDIETKTLISIDSSITFEDEKIMHVKGYFLTKNGILSFLIKEKDFLSIPRISVSSDIIIGQSKAFVFDYIVSSSNNLLTYQDIIVTNHDLAANIISDNFKTGFSFINLIEDNKDWTGELKIRTVLAASMHKDSVGKIKIIKSEKITDVELFYIFITDRYTQYSEKHYLNQANRTFKIEGVDVRFEQLIGDEDTSSICNCLLKKSLYDQLMHVKTTDTVVPENDFFIVTYYDSKGMRRIITTKSVRDNDKELTALNFLLVSDKQYYESLLLVSPSSVSEFPKITIMTSNKKEDWKEKYTRMSLINNEKNILDNTFNGKTVAITKLHDNKVKKYALIINDLCDNTQFV